MPAYRVDFTAVDWESPLQGVRHKVVISDGTKLRLVEYRQDMPIHWCNVGHVGQILEGRFEIEFDAGVHIFESGDGVMIPSGDAHRHRAKALTPVVRALFVETP